MTTYILHITGNRSVISVADTGTTGALIKPGTRNMKK